MPRESSPRDAGATAALTRADLAALLAVLAHDLRNPLSALLTNVNFAHGSRDHGLAHEVAAALSDASLSCSVLGQLIGNIDVLSAVLAELPALPSVIGGRELVAEAVSRVAPLAALAGVRVDLTSPAPWPDVLVDRTFGVRALENLLANAIQFSPARAAVRISCEADADRCVICIEDDGPVIPEALREVVLTAAGQLIAKSTYSARYGRGLGLYCAAEAARMGGAELLAGERAGGSAFTLTAPTASAVSAPR
jgi:signal transduction histidine kinase